MRRVKKPTYVPPTPEERAARELASKRKNWTRAVQYGRTLDETTALVYKTLQDANIRGAKTLQSLSLMLEVDRGGGAWASLSIIFEPNYDRRITNPDNDAQEVWYYDARVEVNWSSTHRNTARAMHAINVYNEVLALAVEVEAILSEENTKRYHGYDPIDDAHDRALVEAGKRVAFDNLIEMYKRWQVEQNLGSLNLGSADEHRYDQRLTEEQREWIRTFCATWDQVRWSL